MKISRRYYPYWRILYTVYWKVDALGWTYSDRFPRFEHWVNTVGIRMGFLIPDKESGDDA